MCYCTVFALFCILYLRAISKYKPLGALIWRGDLTEGFLRYEFGGLISEFYGILGSCGGKECETKRAQDLNPFLRACQPLPQGLFVFAAALLENEKTLGTS